MKSLLIVCACLGAVVATFPLQEKMKFNSKPLPPMNIEEIVSESPQNNQDEESNEPSSFLKALPFSRQQTEAPVSPVVEEVLVEAPKASPHEFILRGITGVGDKKRAVIVVEGSNDAAAYSYTYEDKISDSGYVVYEIHDDHVVLDHTLYADVILGFDYDTDFSASMKKKATDLEQKTQKEISKVYQKKGGASSKSKATADKKMWEERKKRYERFRQMREEQEKNKNKVEEEEKKKKR